MDNFVFAGVVDIATYFEKQCIAHDFHVLGEKYFSLHNVTNDLGFFKTK